MTEALPTTGDGDCFEVAASVLALFDKPYALDDGAKDAQKILATMDLLATDLLLVHGKVTRPSDGFQHDHAWVEIPEQMLVVDFSNGLRCIAHKFHYYEMGCIDGTVEYTCSETTKNLLEHETYGPWENDNE